MPAPGTADYDWQHARKMRKRWNRRADIGAAIGGLGILGGVAMRIQERRNREAQNRMLLDAVYGQGAQAPQVTAEQAAALGATAPAMGPAASPGAPGAVPPSPPPGMARMPSLSDLDPRMKPSTAAQALGLLEERRRGQIADQRALESAQLQRQRLHMARTQAEREQSDRLDAEAQAGFMTHLRGIGRSEIPQSMREAAPWLANQSAAFGMATGRPLTMAAREEGMKWMGGVFSERKKARYRARDENIPRIEDDRRQLVESLNRIDRINPRAPNAEDILALQLDETLTYEDLGKMTPDQVTQMKRDARTRVKGLLVNLERQLIGAKHMSVTGESGMLDPRLQEAFEVFRVQPAEHTAPGDPEYVFPDETIGGEAGEEQKRLMTERVKEFFDIAGQDWKDLWKRLVEPEKGTLGMEGMSRMRAIEMLFEVY